MRHFNLALLMCLMLGSALSAAAQQGISLTGILLDSSRAPLLGATVMLNTPKTGELAGFAISGDDGSFNIAVDSAGTYDLKITFVGYGNFGRTVTIGPEGATNLGEQVLNPNPELLEGVTIEAQIRPIVIKNDTVEYHADAFHAGEHATVEDLLKRLPGVEVAQDGTIKAQGEEVQKVLVDGKEFFDNDPKVATRNIPADVVDKVQVFDDASDFSKFTGIADGEEEKTINLKIKEGKNKGTFGELKAAYGTANRYNAGGNLNRFNKKMQLSALGNGNNISEQGFSMQDYLEFSGGLEDMMSGQGFDASELPMNLLQNRGITEALSGGLNFNYDWGKRTSLRSMYFYDRSENNTSSRGTMGSLFGASAGQPVNSYTTESAANERNLLAAHRARVELRHRFTDNTEASLKVRGSASDTELGGSSEVASLLGVDVLNASSTQSDGTGNNERWDGKLALRHKLKKRGRFVSLEATADGNRRAGESALNNQRQFFADAGTTRDTLNQLRNTAANALGWKADLRYVEPIAEAHFLSLSLRHEANAGRSERLFFQGDAAADQQPDPLLSNQFERDLTRTTTGARWQFSSKSLVYSAGLEAQQSSLNNYDAFRDTRLEPVFQNLLPSASLLWKRTKTSRLRARYFTNVAVPTIEQLQPVVDNSDPLNLYSGNPGLRPEYVHNLNVRYNNMNSFYFRNFFVGLRGRVVANAITEQETISPELVRTRMPVNSDPTWESTLFYDFSSPLARLNLKYRLEGEFTARQTNVLINALSERAGIQQLEQRILLENKKQKVWSWSTGIALNAQWLNYSQSTEINQQFLRYELPNSVRATIKKHWRIELTARYRHYLPTNAGQSTDFLFADATASRYLLDKSLRLYIRGINLFNQLDRLDRNAYGTTYSQQFTNRLPRTILFGAHYKIRSFGK